jgi:hypothetical protein
MDRKFLIVLPLTALLASCGDDAVTDTPAPIANIEVAPAEAAVVPGGTIQLRSDVRDANGRRLLHPVVGWTMAGNTAGVVTLRPVGLVAGIAVGGPATIHATIDGSVTARRYSSSRAAPC